MSNHSDRDGSFSGLVLKDAYHTVLYLNNKIFSMNLNLTQWLKKCDDLSDVKFFDMTNSQLSRNPLILTGKLIYTLEISP